MRVVLQQSAMSNDNIGALTISVICFMAWKWRPQIVVYVLFILKTFLGIFGGART
jgi:hypothetical protein